MIFFAQSISVLLREKCLPEATDGLAAEGPPARIDRYRIQLTQFSFSNFNSKLVLNTRA